MFRGKIKNTDIKDAIKAEKAEALSEEIDYIRFKKGFRRIERGTVITKNRIVWGFPHIRRVFTLEAGIKRNIKTNVVYVEEKIDGYNLRIAKINGRIFAFTRGGYLDPFATEKTREMQNLAKFFKKYPDYVLCAEMIGNTPFTEPTDEFDVKILVFDIDDDGKYLPPLEKYALLREFRIESVKFLGKFDKNRIELVEKLANNLNKGKREGIVIKSADRTDVVKFVTPFADIDDTEKCSYIFFDMPPGFFYQRIIRSSFFINEYSLERDKYSKMLGNAFYSGFIRAIDEVKQGKDIEGEFEVLVGDEKIFDLLKKHMIKEVDVKIISKKKQNGKTRIRFSKTYRKTTKEIRNFLNGKGVID